MKTEEFELLLKKQGENELIAVLDVTYDILDSEPQKGYDEHGRKVNPNTETCVDVDTWTLKEWYIEGDREAFEERDLYLQRYGIRMMLQEHILENKR